MVPMIEDRLAAPDEGLAREAALFHDLEAGRGGEAVYVWESSRPAVILGRSGKAGRDVHEAACRADGVPILRRISGGGAVLIGPGCLNYAFVLALDARPALRAVEPSYAWVLGWLVNALGLPGLRACGGDLAIDGRKVSGSAQRRGRHALLHHGTFLYAFDCALIERYLPEPARQPEYRARRSHAAFVTNAPLPPEDFAARLARARAAPDGVPRWVWKE